MTKSEESIPDISKIIQSKSKLSPVIGTAEFKKMEYDKKSKLVHNICMYIYIIEKKILFIETI
jgi:hypothetical protein